jgi:pimeloyl-ACP methyl ester carboxylesterase
MRSRRRQRKQRTLSIAGAIGVVMLSTLTACTPPGETAEPAEPAETSSGSPATGATEHEIDLGDGRVLYMTCAGEGDQTVVLESGYHESSDTWMVTEDESDRSVFVRLAERYRVCAYDRPGTLLLLGESPTVTERSTPVPMPRSAADVVEDLHAALGASGERGPYILAAHSLGGFLARLYAQTYPDDVNGLVFVDAFPIELRDLMGDTWAPYYSVLNSTGGGQQSEDYEQIDIEAGIQLIEDSAPFPDIPIGVVSKDLPFAGLPADPVGFTAEDLERAWVAGQPALVALRPNTPHLIATGSDHYVHVRQPDLVEAMVDIVAGRAVR